MTRDKWDEKFEKIDDKWHIKKNQTKYKIISIVQYTIAEDVEFFVQSHKNDIKSISTTHPLNFYCRGTNNPLCILSRELLGLTTKWIFSKWYHQSKYWVSQVHG